ncbi:molybdopterin-dependent oxidoreductase [Mobilicoccus caccae]|uniref:Oxidoreductase n=1 Tax=Mobilicoccus caccae TaxID=1859295 RepID=A0ABQ6IPG3_9MICO|nr:molybdopterin-dependent oxidoreductase [Mobilicoccus caccae]GMA39807.1 oxidoreductase [Mobilicoccus caccae]
MNDHVDALADPSPLPPGQRPGPLRPMHYGRVPRLDLASWSLTIEGATVDGSMTRLLWPDLQKLPQTEVRADHHCVAKRSATGLVWAGVPARVLVELAPPATEAQWVLASAAYGYHSNITVDDLLSPRALFATHLNGEPLSPEHGWPVRLVLPHLYGWKGPKWIMALEYLAAPQRGFWEERGYHFTGDVWREERYSHQE